MLIFPLASVNCIIEQLSRLKRNDHLDEHTHMQIKIVELWFKGSEKYKLCYGEVRGGGK